MSLTARGALSGLLSSALTLIPGVAPQNIAPAPAATAQTAPAPATATDLQQGQYIRAGGYLAYCSLTITEGNIGYTAGHCAGGEWKIGSLISDKNGRAIGRIVNMKPGFDVVKIKLNPNLTVDGVYSKRDYSTLTPGEQIYVRGLGRSYPAGTFTGEPLKDWLAYKNIAATVSPSTVEEGTSGGAALDTQGNLVGVNVGEVFDYAPDGSKVNYRESFIPWNIIDQELG